MSSASSGRESRRGKAPLPPAIWITIANEGTKEEFLEAHRSMDDAIDNVGDGGLVAKYRLEDTGTAEIIRTLDVYDGPGKGKKVAA